MSFRMYMESLPAHAKRRAWKQTERNCGCYRCAKTSRWSPPQYKRPVIGSEYTRSQLKYNRIIGS